MNTHQFRNLGIDSEYGPSGQQKLIKALKEAEKEAEALQLDEVVMCVRLAIHVANIKSRRL